MIAREKNGTFAKGNRGGPGRPHKEFVKKYRSIFDEVFTEKRWREILVQQYLDAAGKKIVGDAIVNDETSDPHKRGQAFGRIAPYALGKPIQPIVVGEDIDGELMDMIKGMAEVIQQENDEAKLQGIVDEAMEYLNKAAAQTDAEQ